MAAAATFALPYILPTGRLFAATGNRVVNHVVFCLLAGGVRNLESIQKSEGNLMPSLFNGTEPISNDILGGLDALPNPVNNQALQNYGTLFKEFRYGAGFPGHFQGHTTAITGSVVNNDISFNQPTQKPTVFEFYRKHNLSSNSGLNAWWVSNGIGENQNLSYSSDPSYGAKYSANFFSPLDLLVDGNYTPLDLCVSFNQNEMSRVDQMRSFLNQNFNAGVHQGQLNINTASDREQMDAFITKLIKDQKNGINRDPWNCGSSMNNDMYNIYFAERIIKQFKPELLVVNMTDIDICHNNYTKSCNNMRKADYAVGHLWNTIQNTPGMANDTILIVAPEHGRDIQSNSIIDSFGRYGNDHGDANSKNIFCLIAGPPSKVVQNQVVQSVTGQSIDIVPTIAHILGFKNDIPSHYLSGTPLTQALV